MSQNNDFFSFDDDKAVEFIRPRLPQEIQDKYTDFSFFDISYYKCENIDNNLVIKMTNTNNCITLTTSKIIYNFKINSIEAIEDYYTENSLLYQKDEIKNNTITIKTDILHNPNFKISFDTEYNYTISIFPIQNPDNNKIDYNISHEQKNRP